jgi:site-specific DNA-cytosine methylase
LAYKSKKYVEPTNPVGTVAELFAGVGGFRIGLARAGWKTVFSNQWEPSTKVQHASNVYVARFGDEGHSNKDISKVDVNHITFTVPFGVTASTVTVTNGGGSSTSGVLRF